MSRWQLGTAPAAKSKPVPKYGHSKLGYMYVFWLSSPSERQYRGTLVSACTHHTSAMRDGFGPYLIGCLLCDSALPHNMLHSLYPVHSDDTDNVRVCLRDKAYSWFAAYWFATSQTGTLLWPSVCVCNTILSLRCGSYECGIVSLYTATSYVRNTMWWFNGPSLTSLHPRAQQWQSDHSIFTLILCMEIKSHVEFSGSLKDALSSSSCMK